MINELISNAEKALTPLFQTDSYLYWPYTISTLILAFVIDQTSFFNKNLWLNNSTLQDYKLYFLNFLIVPPIYAWLSFNESSVVLALNLFFSSYLSNTNSPVFSNADTWYFRVAYTVCIFVAYDLGRFVSHWFLHHSPPLWELHKVHHSASALTPMTAWRVHPFEPIFINLVSIISTGFVVWVFHHLVGTSITVYQFLGMHVFLALVNFVDNLRHSPVWISYGGLLNRWLISPAHHQLHHSLEDRHMGCNLGATFAIWDRYAGTLICPQQTKESFRIGLPQIDTVEHTSLRSIYLYPLTSAYRALAPTRASSH